MLGALDDAPADASTFSSSALDRCNPFLDIMDWSDMLSTPVFLPTNFLALGGSKQMQQIIHPFFIPSCFTTARYQTHMTVGHVHTHAQEAGFQLVGAPGHGCTLGTS